MSNNITNILGSGSNIQLQQETFNSSQTQTIVSEETLDFEKIIEFVNKIKKYDNILDDEFGNKATEIREKITDIENLAKKKENPSKIKILLNELKKLSIGVGQGLIATGIAEGIKALIM